MTPAPSLPAARNAYDHALLSLWASQSELLAACESGDAAAVAQWRAVVAADSRSLSLAADLRTAAFDAVAAERAAASPLRLVSRELTPAEASALAAAERTLEARRYFRDDAADHAAWWLVYRALGEDGLMSHLADEEIAKWRADLDRCTALADAALADRAPLLAARWQEVAT